MPGTTLSGSDQLRRENEALRERLSGLSAASLRISESLDLEAALREVADGARRLTGASSARWRPSTSQAGRTMR